MIFEEIEYQDIIVDDYPLLPVRRRFWVEPTAVDQSDTGSPNGTPSTAAIQSPDPTPAAARPLAANPSPVPAETAGPAFVEAIINEQMRLMKAQLEALEK